MLQQYPLLPDFVKPPMRVTNEALFGYAFDETTSPELLVDHPHPRRAGSRTAATRGAWQDGELTPIRRHARAWAAEAPNATEWYYPRRLLLDIDAASPLRQTPAARFLGLRLRHGRRIDVPLYAYSTDLTEGRVARGARRLVALSRIGNSRVVDDRNAAHLDPLSAAPSTNRFLKTVVPFLRRHMRAPAVATGR